MTTLNQNIGWDEVYQATLWFVWFVSVSAGRACYSSTHIYYLSPSWEWGGWESCLADDDGLVYLLNLIIWLCKKHPGVGFSLVIGLCVIIVLTVIESICYYQHRVILKGHHCQDKLAYNQALTKLTKRDPGFNLEQFYNRVRLAYQCRYFRWTDH